jgi:dihydroceramidase
MPWGFVLEGHGWWHLMTGIGAYDYIVWGIYLRHIMNGDQEHFKMVWPSFFTLPEVVRISDPPRDAETKKKHDTTRAVSASRSGNGSANGHLKKRK